MHSQHAGRSGYVIATLATIAALALVGLSAATAYRFGHLLGTSDAGRHIWAIAGVTIACFKALLPFALAAALAQRRWVAFTVAGVALVLCSSYTLSAAYSVASADRAPSITAATSERERQAEIKALGTPRPESVLAPLIAVERDRDAKAKLLSEAARSRELAKLRVKAPSAGGTSESGILSLSEVTGWPPATVRAALLVILAACLEIGEIAGLYLAVLMIPKPRKLDPVPEVAPAVVEERPATVPATPLEVVVAEPKTRPAAKATSAIGKWLDQYLVTARGQVSTDDAWDAYCEWCKCNKKRKLTRLVFARELRDEMAGRGAQKQTRAGKISYLLAA